MSYPSKIRAIRNFLSSNCGAVTKNFIEEKFNVIMDRPVYPWPNREFVASLHLFTRNSISSSFCELPPDQRSLVRKYQSLYSFLKARNKLERYLEFVDVAIITRPIKMKFVAETCEYQYCRSYELPQLEFTDEFFKNNTKINFNLLKRHRFTVEKYINQLTTSDKKPVEYIDIPQENCIYSSLSARDERRLYKFNGKYYLYPGGRFTNVLYQVPPVPTFSHYIRNEYSRLLFAYQEYIAKLNIVYHNSKFSNQQNKGRKSKAKQEQISVVIPPLIIDSSTIKDIHGYDDPDVSSGFVEFRKKLHQRWVVGIRSRRLLFDCLCFAVGPFFNIRFC